MDDQFMPRINGRVDGETIAMIVVPRAVLLDSRLSRNEFDRVRAAIGERLTEFLDPRCPADSLDAAWAEAEAALPEGWVVQSLFRCTPEDWQAWAADPAEDASDPFMVFTDGPTPAAALRALASKLRERAG